MVDNARHDVAYGEDSIILKTTVGFLYPIMMLFGFYVILNGQDTPGGGFQGGGVLAAIFVARFVVHPVDDTDRERLHVMQRTFIALILLTPIVVLFTGFVTRFPEYNGAYLTLMNVLIGLQVGVELGVAVLRFGFFEGVGQTWHL
ncbi:MAG: Na(+)/H(+) antiporter subunit B [Spirochaetota bacterium]